MFDRAPRRRRLVVVGHQARPHLIHDADADVVVVVVVEVDVHDCDATRFRYGR